VRLLVKSAFLLTLLVAATTDAWAADGRILSIEGDVRVNGKPATLDTPLQREDKIVTAEGASVRIVLADNSVLDLDSGSEILLSDYNYDPSGAGENKSDISVVEGSLRYVSGLIAKENPDSIKFTAADSVIGIRGSYTGIDVDGVVVNVEAMIGEATLQKEDEDGKKDRVIVPTGQTTITDPATGEVLVIPSTEIDPVNAVVRAIAAIVPDATDPEDEGCSRGKDPLRAAAVPEVDPAAVEDIDKQLAALSEGELLMVIAVLNNNARHLCIDATTIAYAITLIAKVNPNAAISAASLAGALDPENSNAYNNAATQTQNTQGRNNQTKSLETDIPPGGTGDPPSPE